MINVGLTQAHPKYVAVVRCHVTMECVTIMHMGGASVNHKVLCQHV